VDVPAVDAVDAPAVGVPAPTEAAADAALP
jgi:hypothetical protein